jgi:hypothetical protein
MADGWMLVDGLAWRWDAGRSAVAWLRADRARNTLEVGRRASDEWHAYGPHGAEGSYDETPPVED